MNRMQPVQTQTSQLTDSNQPAQSDYFSESNNSHSIGKTKGLIRLYRSTGWSTPLNLIKVAWTGSWCDWAYEPYAVNFFRSLLLLYSLNNKYMLPNYWNKNDTVRWGCTTVQADQPLPGLKLASMVHDRYIHTIVLWNCVLPQRDVSQILIKWYGNNSLLYSQQIWCHWKIGNNGCCHLYRYWLH